MFIPAAGVGALADAMHWANAADSSDGGWIVFAWIFFIWLYETVSICSPWQATIGKKSVGIVVTDVQGRRLSFIRANGRYFANILSTYTIIGKLMPLWTRHKQGLHDKVIRAESSQHLPSLRRRARLPGHGPSKLPRYSFFLDAYSLNSAGERSRLWVSLLERLTCLDRLDVLTTLPWAKTISCVHLLRTSRAWWFC
jgi:hypothetical protein